MTSESKESCSVCMNSFNQSNRENVVLHCGHDFCLSCLVSLHLSGSHKCPTCRADWTWLELKAIAGLNPEATVANGQEVEPKARNPPSAAAALIESLLTSNDKLLIEQSWKEPGFKEDSIWTVDNKNYLAALLALSHKKKPMYLTFTGHYDQPNAIPKWAVSAIAEATPGIDVMAHFWDAFYKPQLASNNNEELKSFLQKDRLNMFVGHLDAVGIASLPTSISVLGLAINSAADAEAVSNLKTWKRLTLLCVAVSYRVSVQDLKPLPGEAKKILYFFGLTNDQIHRVRPVISALVPSLSLEELNLHNCNLTAAGFRSLAQLLQGATIARVCIAPQEQFYEDVRISIAVEIRAAVKGNVSWDSDEFFY